MPSCSVVLRDRPDPLDEDWTFNGLKQLPVPHPADNGAYLGLHISFTPEKIVLDLVEFPSNRILQTDDPSLFLLASFKALRFQDVGLKINIEYITRCLHSGVTLNGRKYFFYGHSDSQLRGRSCFLRHGKSEAGIHDQVLSLGDFRSIKNPAKFAKRFGLLFNPITIDWKLDPSHTRDIPDLEDGDALFSDGCGLISQYYAKLLSKEKQIIFRQVKYMPSVFQIRYKGYKGVLTVHPLLDKQNNGHVHLRKSMRKLPGVPNNTFAVIDYSVPYVYGRLNNDTVTLLSSLGIGDNVLLDKLRDYLSSLESVHTDLSSALDFVSSIKQHSLVERILLEGLDSDGIQRDLTRALKGEIGKFIDKDAKNKVRVLVK